MIKQYIAKIEGHGTLKIDFKSSKADLRIEEGERLIEGIMLDRPYYDAPFITSRICGVCPIAHNLAAILSLENALNIKVDPITKNLRLLLDCSQMIQSHALHLYFLALSDYTKTPSTLSLANSNPDIFNDALKIKKASDHITDIVGGRNVHPITTDIGGFRKIPTKSALKKILFEINESFEAAKNTVKLFSSFAYPKIHNKTIYLALTKPAGYTVISDQVEVSTGKTFSAKNYTKNIIETVRQNSPVKYSTYKDKPFMLGALARISLNANRLNPIAKKMYRQSINNFDTFPAYNSFHNNFAQAIEIVHFFEEAQKLTNKLIKNKNYKKYNTKYKIKAGTGHGTIEAPRGILYQNYELDNKGIIKNCNILTPTAQSLTNLESDVNVLLKNIKDLPRDKQYHMVEMLIRAYDPCITCSVH